MCGIAGFVRLDGAPADAREGTAMSDRIRHRGPDGDGTWTDGPAALGHRRLAIIDPAHGEQPVANEDGTLWIVYNGELYNFRELRAELESRGHRFRTHCDTEVVVHAYQEWGERCLDRMRGMYAFAIRDRRNATVFLARDRFGIKPLIYASTPDRIAFASELQCFDALPGYEPSVDLQAVDLYLQFQYIPAPYTIFREARKLPAAHWMRVHDNGRVEGPHRYWNLEFHPDESVSEAEWLERLDAALRETVTAHLVSDVPFGAFLSGGVDSSTVVAYMSEVLRHPVKTFSIGYDESEYDESRYAREVARRFGTEHHEEIVRPDALGVLPELVRHYGEPMADSSAIPTYYVSRLAARHVKMVLSGDGGDELFAGYTSYPYLLWSQRKPAAVSGRVRHALAGVARRAGVVPPLPSPEQVWFDNTSYFPEAMRRRLWRPEHHGLAAGTRAWYDGQFGLAPQDDLCARFQYIDVNGYLTNDILAKVDIASMCHSLEVRVPLIDHAFTDVIARIPSRFKVKWASGDAVLRDDVPLDSAVGKYILKKNAERFLPRELLTRPKRGFDVPIRDWLGAGAHGETRERLLGSADLGELFVPELLEEMLATGDAAARHGWRLWAMLFLDEWLTQYRRSRAGVPAT
ncbi:MAG TPA: asparagine synthase (glutamine-hydrolyzing) [Thermoanaerobaculia bacterium]